MGDCCPLGSGSTTLTKGDLNLIQIFIPFKRQLWIHYRNADPNLEAIKSSVPRSKIMKKNADPDKDVKKLDPIQLERGVLLRINHETDLSKKASL